MPDPDSRSRTPPLALGTVLVLLFVSLLPWGREALARAVARGDLRAGLAPGEELVDADVVVVHRNADGELTPPDGLIAKLVRDGGGGEELSFPVGVYFRPPPGLYRFWIEGEGLITPFAARLPRVGEVLSDVSLVGVAPTVAAGRVKVSRHIPPQAASSELRIAILRLGQYLEQGATRHELLRWIEPARGEQDTPMPAGEVLAALWDAKLGAPVALSRPHSLRAGATAVLKLEKPTAGAHLLLRAKRGEPGAASVDEFDEATVVWQGEEAVAPNATAHAADTFYAFWYDLAPGPAEVEATWQGRFLDRTIELGSGQVAAADGTLGGRPSLLVELALPSEVGADSVDLLVRSRFTGRLIATERWRPGRSSGRFADLPPTRLLVELRSRLGVMREDVDLGSGEDGYLRLEPAVTIVQGIVRVGGEPQQASLEFRTVDGAAVTARAEADGRYEALALEPLGQVSITFGRDSAPPWTDFFPKALTGSVELDFDLPQVHNRIRVLDAQTLEGIEGATVAFVNRYERGPEADGEPPEGSEGRFEKAVAQAVITDETGEAELPALRTGTIEFRAFASGYRSLRTPLRLSVADGSESQEFEIMLEREEEMASIRLVLDSGAPADSAELLAFESLESAVELHSTRADSAGVARIPRTEAPLVLFVRHWASGSTVRVWNANPDGSETLLRLPTPARLTLSLRVLGSVGGAGSRSADLGIVTEAGVVHGRLLSWLYSARRSTDTWHLDALPAAPVTLLAWEPSRQSEVERGGFRGPATTLDWPWLNPAEIRALE